MKCISLWQPWATLWLLSDPDEKVFETRHWYTAVRGPVLVHAAKKQVRETMEAIHGFGPALIRHGIHGPSDLAFGAIIGKVELIGCSRMSVMPEPSEREEAAGHWSPDRYAWERAGNPVLFDKPIPYRGAQGFFEVPACVLAETVLNEWPEDLRVREFPGVPDPQPPTVVIEHPDGADLSGIQWDLRRKAGKS